MSVMTSLPLPALESLDRSLGRVAVLIPCCNEAATIGRVVGDFRAALPGATIYVYDNNSRDRTVEIARAAGAVVRRELRQGKGHVVCRMFADIEADIYVLVDGDDTYDAAVAPSLVRLLMEGTDGSGPLDMVCGARVTDIVAAYRPGHRFGNAMLTGLVSRIFGNRLTDMLSGYRVFSRRYVKSFPSISSGFEIETDFTVHALELRMPIAEVPTAYRDRPEDSVSKLRTYRDGTRILWMIFRLCKAERPLQFFSLIAGMLAVIALVLAAPVVSTYLASGLVPRLPTALLATGTMLLAFLSLTCGLILDTVTRGRWEHKRMRYLEIAAAGGVTSLPAAARSHGG